MNCCAKMKRIEATGMVHNSVALTYMGNVALTAVGPMTGRRYKFAARGAVLAVDSHDVPALLRVPNLLRAR